MSVTCLTSSKVKQGGQMRSQSLKTADLPAFPALLKAFGLPVWLPKPGVLPLTWCPQVPEADSHPPWHGPPSTRMTAPLGQGSPRLTAYLLGCGSPIPLADWPNRTDYTLWAKCPFL